MDSFNFIFPERELLSNGILFLLVQDKYFPHNYS